MLARRSNDLLMRRWQQAKEGEGRVVLLSGEPGIGKSRLIQAIEGRLSGEPHIRLRFLFASSRGHPASSYRQSIGARRRI
jgi:predicted ATPase